jgi:hypothetical protein
MNEHVMKYRGLEIDDGFPPDCRKEGRELYSDYTDFWKSHIKRIDKLERFS